MADFDLKQFFLRWRVYLLAVLVGTVVMAILWCVPPWLVEQVMAGLDKPDAYRIANLEDAYRRTLAQILGGLVLLYGLYLTQRRIVATEENVRVAQEGQVTERFTRAIEQLGHKEMAIRLGGIYALERLAKDSKKDYGPIMEVLTAYVREKAPRKENHKPQPDEKPPTDIQAILTVIGRRETTGGWDDRLDLTHTQLVGVRLSGGANLNAAILIEADLREARLIAPRLAGANLIEADLRGARLIMADLRGADLRGAKLAGADLIEADLSEAENLTAEQVKDAKNWHRAHLPDYLQYLLAEQPAPPA